MAQIFNFKDRYPVRVETKENNEPWFVAKDVCKALDIANHIDAVSRLDKDEKSGIGITDPHGRVQEMLVINEAGVYSLIFRSRKPEAKQFKRWVTHEVLPSIRKHGAYMSTNTLIEMIQNPDSITTLLEALKQEKIKTGQLEEKVGVLQPKADKLENHVDPHSISR